MVVRTVFWGRRPITLDDVEDADNMLMRTRALESEHRRTVSATARNIGYIEIDGDELDL